MVRDADWHLSRCIPQLAHEFTHSDHVISNGLLLIISHSTIMWSAKVQEVYCTFVFPFLELQVLCSTTFPGGFNKLMMSTILYSILVPVYITLACIEMLALAANEDTKKHSITQELSTQHCL